MPPERQNRPNQRNRPRVPDSARKRAAQACLLCRHHKEKCGGGVPCARCQKYNRTCRFEHSRPQSTGREAGGNLTVATPSASAPNRDALMMRIVRHFMGDISFDPDNLQRIVDGLGVDSHAPRTQSSPESDNAVLESFSLDPLSTSTMHYSGELSHWNFSRMLRRRLQKCGVSLDTFLQFAQTNYYYFDESTFRRKMEYYYSNQHLLTIHDAGWLCTLLMTFAIGTQNEHPHLSRKTDDRIGLELYRFSCRLIPDMISVASVETVQGFLLLGVYTLPIDTSGLAYTYYGLAVKMAVQNGMHRNSSGVLLDPKIAEWRNRLWWCAYSSESRTSILHGRPVSISRSEVDADLPSIETNLLPSNGASNLLNVKANIHLTEQLGKLAHVILRMRKCLGVSRAGYFEQLMKIRTDLRDWWELLPKEVHCRDLSPNGPLFRCNLHLELSYATAIIFMGRPFILSSPQQQNAGSNESFDDTQMDGVRALATDCLDAAVRVIALCQVLQDTVGLARVSYTEFSSCRAALLALIALSLNQQNRRVRDNLSQGMGLIRQMCPSVESALSDVAVIEALERATRRLHRYADTFAYNQFQRWAQLWRVEPSTHGQDASLGYRAPGDTIPCTTTPPPFDGFFSSFPQELNAFAAIPGSEEQLPFDVVWPDETQVSSHLAEPSGEFSATDHLL
ncbi:fungal-specific transcription factor domain-containing protein [Aspergillus carlsbadensis]|nr:fungal-specific transcription factor domain-containing protein [Aspergillus carlsbadensis]